MRFRNIGRRLTPVVITALLSGVAVGQKMVWVEKGVGKAPIIVATNAPKATLQATEELADYVRKISGVRPPILTGCPDPMPTNAVWVGVQPGLSKFFPVAQLEFHHPEEILYACNGQHVVIAGSDRMAGTNQTEYGTANAVYTFVEKKLDVRWLWPGELGEDILPRVLGSLFMVAKAAGI